MPGDTGKIVSERYRLEASIGNGAFGVVYRAKVLGSEQMYAVKIMEPQDILFDPTARERFRLEAVRAQEVVHANAVRVVDSGEFEGEPYLVMELLTGETLREELDRHHKLAPKRVASVARDVALALAAAHAQKIVHRDIKPENIFLHHEGEHEIVKVLDFGVATSTDRTLSTLTSTGAVVGTPLYIAPERLRGEPFDGRSDVFALGITMYGCLSGGKPFAGDSNELVDIVVAVMNEEPRPLLELQPDVPVALAELVMRAIQPDPAARPQAKEFAELLEAWLSR